LRQQYKSFDYLQAKRHGSAVAPGGPGIGRFSRGGAAEGDITT
jgi:hypothetical protein